MALPDKKAIIVLGMHRSGTSALSGVLQRLGIDFGNSLMPAMEGVNEKGFYEHKEIVNLHEELLTVLGYNWFDVRSLPEDWCSRQDIIHIKGRLSKLIRKDFDGVQLWGLKDPRICRLLLLWVSIFSELRVAPCFIHIVRHPSEVVASLAKRDGLDETGSLISWFRHILEAEYDTRNYPRAFLAYDAFLANHAAILDNIAEEIEVDWPIPLADATDDINRFLDGGLRHNRVESFNSSEGLMGLANQLCRCIKQRDFSKIDEIKSGFQIELEKTNIDLEHINQKQKLSELLTHTQHALAAEKRNAAAQIEYRDSLVKELEEKISAEKRNAAEQIEYRDGLVKELEEKVSAEKRNAAEQIEYRDGLVKELEEKVSAEKRNAATQTEYRDSLIKDLRGILSSRRRLLKLLLLPNKKDNT